MFNNATNTQNINANVVTQAHTTTDHVSEN